MDLVASIKRHIGKPTDLGSKLLALPSIIKFPRAYRLGKEAVYMECAYCHQRPRDLADTEYVKRYGFCLGCEDRHTDYMNEARDDYEDMMEMMGLDPEDPEDVESYQEYNRGLVG